jgi:hypothetical protein
MPARAFPICRRKSCVGLEPMLFKRSDNIVKRDAKRGRDFRHRVETPGLFAFLDFRDVALRHAGLRRELDDRQVAMLAPDANRMRAADQLSDELAGQRILPRRRLAERLFPRRVGGDSGAVLGILDPHHENIIVRDRRTCFLRQRVARSTSVGTLTVHSHSSCPRKRASRASAAPLTPGFRLFASLRPE